MINRSEREMRRMRRVAERYRREGYDVVVEPQGTDLPQWLRVFNPDLIAIGDDESVVIEVKSRDELQGDLKLNRLAALVDRKPSWRFALDISNPREPKDEMRSASVASEAHVRRYLHAAHQLKESGLNEQALVSAWAAFEGAGRRILADEGVDPTPPSPLSVVKNLFSLGFLDPRSQDHLRGLVDVRNRAAHGFTSERDINEDDLEELIRITERLLMLER